MASTSGRVRAEVKRARPHQRDSGNRCRGELEKPARQLHLIRRGSPPYRGRQSGRQAGDAANQSQHDCRRQEARRGPGTERRARLEDQLARGAFTDPELASDLAAGLSVHRAADQGGSLRLGKSGKRRQRLTESSRLAGFVSGGPTSGQRVGELERCRMSLAVQGGDRAAVGDRVQPRSQRVDLHSRAKRVPGGKQGILHRVLSRRRPGDPGTVTEQQRLVVLNDEIERSLIPRATPLNESGVALVSASFRRSRRSTRATRHVASARDAPRSGTRA